MNRRHFLMGLAAAAALPHRAFAAFAPEQFMQILSGTAHRRAAAGQQGRALHRLLAQYDTFRNRILAY
jgi:hypothetical protein